MNKTQALALELRKKFALTKERAYRLVLVDPDEIAKIVIEFLESYGQ